MIRRPPRSTLDRSSAASDVYKRQPEISGVRIGKHITLHVEAADKKAAEAKVDEACKKLLANQIMEKYAFSVEEA